MLLALKIAGSLAAVYVLVPVLTALLQDRLLFPRWAVGPGVPLPATAERLVITVGPGDELVSRC